MLLQNKELLHRAIERVQKAGFISAKQAEHSGIIESALLKASPFQTWDAAKPPLVNYQTVDKNAFESAKRLPLTPKLSPKSLKLSRVFVSNYNLFSA